MAFPKPYHITMICIFRYVMQINLLYLTGFWNLLLFSLHSAINISLTINYKIFSIGANSSYEIFLLKYLTVRSYTWFHLWGFLENILATSISICSDCHRFSELSAWDSELAFWRLACLQAFHVPNLDSELLI